MRAVTWGVLALALASFANAENTPDELKAIQEVADSFLKAAADNDFDAFKEKVSSKRRAEYEKNKEVCPLSQWWDNARRAIEEQGAAWTFVDVRINTDNIVELVYQKTADAGAKEVSIFMRKEGDVWLVDAAGGAFAAD